MGILTGWSNKDRKDVSIALGLLLLLGSLIVYGARNYEPAPPAPELVIEVNCNPN